MRSVKKLLIITLFLGMTLPVFAQETQSVETQSVTTQSATDQAFLPKHHRRGHHIGHGNRGRHVGPPAPTPTPTPAPPPPPGCTYKFDPAGARAVAAGESGMVMVTVLTGTGCPLSPTAVSASNFIQVTAIGGQIVSFHVDPNPTNFSRSGTIVINGIAYGVAQDGAFPNFDGTYNFTYNFTLTYVGPPPGPPPVSGSGTFAVTVKNGVVVPNGAETGTINSFGEVSITVAGGPTVLSLTGSMDETGHGLGILSGGGIPFVAVGGSCSATRQ
jgi:hypothetical protein